MSGPAPSPAPTVFLGPGRRDTLSGTSFFTVSKALS